jgi:hypothetical protein
MNFMSDKVNLPALKFRIGNQDPPRKLLLEVSIAMLGKAVGQTPAPCGKAKMAKTGLVRHHALPNGWLEIFYKK